MCSANSDSYNHTKTPTKLKKEMQCTYNGCTNTFISYPHARFCDYHKDPVTRPVEKKVEEKTTFRIEHNFTETTLIELTCQCCGAPYRVYVLPGTYEYSKYCHNHRPLYKRNQYKIYLGNLNNSLASITE